ncbi:MAG: GNAT family N-acetyltransferase [Isosphaeraceae bacterium]|nr:GNAT family N-acetyltransferase [Isosphaeraceae bacterium]
MPFADLALARRIEGAWARSSVETAEAHEGRLPGVGVAIMPVAGGVAVFHGARSTLSQAQGLGLNGAVNDADLEQLEAFYQVRGVPAQVEVCTLADPSLWALLGKRGYRPSEPSHVLIRPIAAGEAWGQPPAPLEVETVGTDDATAFAETVLGAFFESPATPPDELRAAVLTTFAVSSATCWLARVAGAPAGGATAFVVEGVALFAGDGVLPAFRGRGIHDALLRARLARVASLGCDLAVTCTQPGSVSQRNAERVGFRVAYARLLFLRD